MRVQAIEKELPLAPTPERQAKSALLAPEKSRTTDRPSWQAVGIWTRMWKAGDLDHEQAAAIDRLERHYQGSLGSDVRMGTLTGGDGGERQDFARADHARFVMLARDALTDRSWQLLQLLFDEPDMTLGKAGALVTQFKNADHHRCAAVLIVQESADRLVKLWGRLAAERRRNERKDGKP